MSKKSTLPLSELTPRGIELFREIIASAPKHPIDEVLADLINLAENPKTSTVLNAAIDVPLFPDLSTRQKTAELTDSLLNKAQITAEPSTKNTRLFSWLAAVFLPAICKQTDEGKLQTNEECRYILSNSSRDFYRHLVACPVWMLQRYGTNARIFLCQRASIMPDVIETIISRPELGNSAGVIELIDRLYWDPAASAPRTGFTATDRLPDPPPGYAKASPKAGTLRALEWTLGQLQCTYDLRSMTADQILRHLPAEFTSLPSPTN